MIENIAMWGGIAGCVLALFAIIIMFATKQNIKNLLNKDEILFYENFNLKKDSILKALNLLDEIPNRGIAIKRNPEFNQKAQQCYNDLLCVISDIRVADEFYDVALSDSLEMNMPRMAQLKLMLRDDLGLKIKRAKIVERAIAQNNSVSTISQPRPVQPQLTQPMVRPTVERPVQPIVNNNIQKPVARPGRPKSSK